VSAFGGPDTPPGAQPARTRPATSASARIIPSASKSPDSPRKRYPHDVAHDR
jgi:hypothetical protein